MDRRTTTRHRRDADEEQKAQDPKLRRRNHLRVLMSMRPCVRARVRACGTVSLPLDVASPTGWVHKIVIFFAKAFSLCLAGYRYW